MSRDAAIEAIHKLGGGQVLDQALARDAEGLLESIAWEDVPCDEPRLIRRSCEDAGVAPGTSIQAMHLENSTRYFDRAYVGAFLESLVGDPEADLVFAARTTEHLGLSFALPAPTQRPIGGGSPLQGIWFDVRPGSSPTIDRIYFFTEFSGPRQFYQAFYQPQGGELLYFDEDKAPGPDPIATPNAAPTRP
jgi:hypothetical protein